MDAVVENIIKILKYVSFILASVLLIYFFGKDYIVQRDQVLTLQSLGDFPFTIKTMYARPYSANFYLYSFFSTLCKCNILFFWGLLVLNTDGKNDESKARRFIFAVVVAILIALITLSSLYQYTSEDISSNEIADNFIEENGLGFINASVMIIFQSMQMIISPARNIVNNDGYSAFIFMLNLIYN